MRSEDDTPLTAEERKRAREKAWRKKHPEKSREYSQRYYKRNRDKERERTKKWHHENPNWQKEWNAANPDKIKAIKKRHFSKPENMEKQKRACARWRVSPEGKANLHAQYVKRYTNPVTRLHYLINAARNRSQKRGLEFEEALYSLTKNPPTHCVCCSVEFDYTTTSARRRVRTSRSPSLDRIDSSLGYTVANVAIICWRCNNAKGPATIEELKMLAIYVEREQAARKNNPDAK